jgi:hypothetical protein
LKSEWTSGVAGIQGTLRAGARDLREGLFPFVEGKFQYGAANHAMTLGVDPELLTTTAAWVNFGAVDELRGADARYQSRSLRCG